MMLAKNVERCFPSCIAWKWMGSVGFRMAKTGRIRVDNSDSRSLQHSTRTAFTSFDKDKFLKTSKMGEPEAKRVKTEYELIYWPGIPGRGEVVRLLFEETGTPYIDVAKGKKAVDAVCAYSDLKNVGDDKNPPKFAAPVLKHGELVINQLPNILLYLAPRLGLGPASGDGVYHLNEIALTILDGFLNEVHETHHPVGTAAYYEDQKDEAKTRSKAFREERLPKYLKYVQRVLDGERSGEGGWLYGGELTYVDLVLFQCLDGTKYAFPKTVEKLKQGGKYASVFKLYDAVKERPNVKAYLESDRRVAYADGIWRHYPELEEDEE